MNPCANGLDSEKLHDEIIIGAGHMARGVKDARIWHQTMAKEFGPEIKPYLQDMYARSKATYDTAMQTVLAKKIKARDVRLEKRTKEYEKRIAEGDFAKRVREKLPVAGESVAKQEAFENARKRFEAALQKKELESQGPIRAYSDKAVALSRWSKLTGIETIGKIAGAATVRVAQRTVEAAFNSMMRRTPYIGRIFKGASVEGAGISSLPAYYKGVYQGLKDIPGVLAGRIKTSENIRPSPFSGTVTKWLDRSSVNLHAAGKRPAYKAAYDHASAYLKKEATELGKDLSDPQVLTEIHEAAKAAGERSIFLRDNLASQSLNVLVNYLEHAKIAPRAGFAAAKMIRLLLPIVRVPTNVALETVNMSGGGLVAGAFKTARIMAKGLDNVTTAEKASLVRSYKKGAIGAALFTTGLLLKDHFGRPYDPKHPAQPGEIKEGEAEVLGVRVPRWLMHAPPLLTMQAGADTAHLMEEKLLKSGVKPGANMAAAYGQALQHVMREVPFIKEVSTLDSLLGGGWDSNPSKELGKQVVGLIPQIIQNVAKWTDQHDGDAAGWPWPLDYGYPLQRKPTDVGQQIEMAIPGLRGRVPTREEVEAEKKMQRKAKSGKSGFSG
jgi:hypothetical protein